MAGVTRSVVGDGMPCVGFPGGNTLGALRNDSFGGRGVLGQFSADPGRSRGKVAAAVEAPGAEDRPRAEPAPGALEAADQRFVTVRR